jgi:hypothetical protein
MPKNGLTERWTVPQAAVWIRTRDLATVREAGPYSTRSLVTAALGFPDIFTASECLIAALRAGRVAAYGRLIKRRVTEVEEAPARILSAGREKIAQEFWTDGGDLSDDLERGIVARAPAGDATRWADLDVEANACIGHWQPPSAILADGALSLGQAAARIKPEPIDHLRWLLTHPAVKVTGLNAASQRVMIDLPTLSRVSDHKGTENIIRIAGDGPCWWEVTIELADQSTEMNPMAFPSRPSKAVAFASEPPVDNETVKLWMVGKIIEWRKVDKSTNLPMMVNAARAEFSDQGLGERRARKIYSTLDKKWKGRRGPKGPRISIQNS